MDEPKKVDHEVTQENLDAGKFEGSQVGDIVQVEAPEHTTNDSSELEAGTEEPAE